MNVKTRTAVACALTLGVAGCGTSDPVAKISDPVVPIARVAPANPLPLVVAARPQPKLAVTLDGKALSMVSALAWKLRDGNAKVVVSSVPLSCAEVTGDGRALHDGEVAFDLEIGPLLQPDGTRAMRLRDTYFRGFTRQQALPVTTTGDASPDQPTTIVVDFMTYDMATPAHTIVAKGTIDAVGCAKPAETHVVPPLPLEMPATLEIAGVKLPIRGAMISHGKSPDLRLTTGGEGCDSKPFYSSSPLELRLTWFDPTQPEIGQVTVDGQLIGTQDIDQTYDKKKVVVTPMPIAPGELTLNIDTKIFDYPVKVTGKVTAVSCPQ